MKQKKAVLFDMDGTLVDSMWMWEDIDIEYLGRFGISLPSDLQKAIEGMSFSETAAYFKERFSLPCTLEEIKADWNRMAYEKYAREVPLKPGAGRFLAEMKRQGIPMGIATSNSMELVRAVLGRHRIADCFGTICIGCQVAKGKPAPDIYLRAAELLGVAPQECMALEDSPNGIRSGIAAGMYTVMIPDMIPANEELLAIASNKVDTLLDIMPLLDELGAPAK